MGDNMQWWQECHRLSAGGMGSLGSAPPQRGWAPSMDTGWQLLAQHRAGLPKEQGDRRDTEAGPSEQSQQGRGEGGRDRGGRLRGSLEHPGSHHTSLGHLLQPLTSKGKGSDVQSLESSQWAVQPETSPRCSGILNWSSISSQAQVSPKVNTTSKSQNHMSVLEGFLADGSGTHLVPSHLGSQPQCLLPRDAAWTLPSISGVNGLFRPHCSSTCGQRANASLRPGHTLLTCCLGASQWTPYSGNPGGAHAFATQMSRER